MRKKQFKYNCIRCRKNKVSTNPYKLTCNACLTWNKPGIGQIDMFGNVVNK